MSPAGHILLADDDEFFRAMTSEQLSTQGHRVRSATDGVMAVAMAEADVPDLILLDLVLPQMDGLQALQVLRNNPRTAQVPVFMVTARQDEDSLLRSLRLGAEDVLRKPINQEELLLKVDNRLRRKHREDSLNDLISQHLDPSVAYQLLHQHQPGQRLSMRRTHICVLFSDLRDFTQVAESIEPEQTAWLLNTLFEELVACVLRYGGTLDKFLGDGLMALFGAPIDYADKESRAVWAALDMLSCLEKLDERFRPLTGRSVDLGIGIAAGEVVVGPLGSQTRMNYTAIGDPVNVAARLTARAKGREIIINDKVAQALDGQIIVDPMEAVQLKGKSRAQSLFRVRSGQRVEVALRRKT